MAAKLGYRSVDAWMESTTHREQAYMTALAMLDGWGEEWQEIAARLVNLLRGTAQHEIKAEDVLTSHDVRRRWTWLDDSGDEQAAVDWGAAATAMRQQFAGMQ